MKLDRTCDSQSAAERHRDSSGTKEVQQGWAHSSFKSPRGWWERRAALQWEISRLTRLTPLIWTGPHSASPGSLAIMTNVTSSRNLNVRRGRVWSLVAPRISTRPDGESAASPVSLPLTQGLFERRYGDYGKADWDLWVRGLMSSVYICRTFLRVSHEEHLPLWRVLARPCSRWLLEGAWIWKEANLISRSQNPTVSRPLCKLPVNEWAGHLTPRGSTSGSPDHQLLCLGMESCTS